MFTINIKKIVSFFLFLLVLASFYFYQPIFISDNILKIVSWGLIFVGFIVSFKAFFYKSRNYYFINSLRLLISLMILSLFTTFIFRGQSPLLTLRATFPYLGYVIYFFLIRTKPSKDNVEKLIWLFTVLYCCFYFLALWYSPEVIFGNPEKDINDLRGFIRVFVPGKGFLFLSFFLVLGKYLKGKNIKWLLLSLFLFLIIVLHVVRQYIFFSFLIGFLFLFKEIQWWKKVIFPVLIIVVIWSAYAISPVLQTLNEMTQEQVSDEGFKDDVRYKAYNYFFSEFSENIVTDFIGNGVPHVDSKYGQYYSSLNENKKIYMSDVGYAQVYALFGILGLITILILFVKVFLKRVPLEYQYARMFLIFGFFSNILSDFLLNISAIASICFSLYIIEIYPIRGNSTHGEKNKTTNEIFHWNTSI